MQIQTVFRAGNSNVVAIPKDLSKETGIKAGQKVIVGKSSEDELVIRKFTGKKVKRLFRSFRSYCCQTFHKRQLYP